MSKDYLKVSIIVVLLILPVIFLMPEQKVQSQRATEQIKSELQSSSIPQFDSQRINEISGYLRRFDFTTPKTCINQICDYYITQYMRNSTTTPCNIELPRATTTPISITILANATSSPIIWTIATSTTLNATTSLIYEIANSRNQIVATTTTGASPASGVIFGPVNRVTSQFLVFGAKGGSYPRGANTFVNGVCKVHLQEL